MSNAELSLQCIFKNHNRFHWRKEHIFLIDVQHHYQEVCRTCLINEHKGITHKLNKSEKREMPIAMKNLSIAQARDWLMYAYTQGEAYRPKLKQYWVGNFVNVKR